MSISSGAEFTWFNNIFLLFWTFTWFNLIHIFSYQTLCCFVGRHRCCIARIRCHWGSSCHQSGSSEGKSSCSVEVSSFTLPTFLGNASISMIYILPVIPAVYKLWRAIHSNNCCFFGWYTNHQHLNLSLWTGLFVVKPRRNWTAKFDSLCFFFFLGGG